MTAYKIGDDGNDDDNWMLMTIDGEDDVSSGTQVRLQHNATKAMLHSHRAVFVLQSGRSVQEVTGFKIGNTDDYWVILLPGTEGPATGGEDRRFAETAAGEGAPGGKGILVIHCSTWEDFRIEVTRKLFNNEPFQRSSHIFRGHGDPAWSLNSTFDRWFEKGQNKDKARVADRLIEQFAKECEGFEIADRTRNDKVKMLALAQHHGLPTRLLDWTESPYVAAFFAFGSGLFQSDKKDHVAVWALDTQNPIWSAEYGVEIVDVATFGNDRLRHQTGKFTYLKAPYDSLEEFVRHFVDIGIALREYLIPTSERKHALADLDAMGINYSRIFPDLEGFAKAAWMRISLDY